VVPPEDKESLITVDLGRVRVVVDPGAMWRQMFQEQGRLMRDHFWVADMAGVDWDEVLQRYRPVVDRVATRDDLSEVLWETVGELGTSHAYEDPPARPVDAALRLGHLGADLARDDDGTWRVARVLPGEPSVPAARSPLLAPGVGVGEGDAVLAVDGRPVQPGVGPGPLLVGTASRPTELTVRAAAGEVRRVVVVPLADERPVRYHDWVSGRRRAVHAATGGRVGYLHVPDMMAGGWAQLHRDLHTEVRRDALVVDLRANGGGHLSELVLEKLSRRIRARSVSRHAPEETWPSDAPRGPMVCVTNQWAGSDGDIGTAMFRALGLGPVVGTRTWGGVVGIDGRYSLVDGTAVTQPRYGFWMVQEGWGIENYGVDPDIEVQHPPQAWAAGEDPQLDVAVRLVVEALESYEPVPEPDPTTRPDRAAPTLPPRPGA
jgi:tricorn protease